MPNSDVELSCWSAVDARTLQRVEGLEQSFLQYRQQVQTQLDSMQVRPLFFCCSKADVYMAFQNI